MTADEYLIMDHHSLDERVIMGGGRVYDTRPRRRRRYNNDHDLADDIIYTVADVAIGGWWGIHF